MEEKRIISRDTKPIEAQLPKPVPVESKKVTSFGSHQVIETLMRK